MSRSGRDSMPRIPANLRAAMAELGVARTAAILAVVCGLLALIGLAVYWPVLDDFFALDDFIWLQSASNPSPGDYFKDAFSFPLGTLFDAPTPFWRPLVDTYFFVAWRTWEDNPVPYHAVNLGLHLVTAALVGVLAKELTKTNLIAAAVAVLFLVFPAYDFAVTWISSVTELLATTFYMLTLVLFLRHQQTGRPILFALALASFLLALLSKESSVTAPLVMLLLALSIGSPTSRQEIVRIGRKVSPFFLLGAAYFLFLFWQEYRSSADAGFYRFGWHVLENVWSYLKVLTLPVSPDRGDWVEALRPWTAAAFLAGSILLFVRREVLGVALVMWVFLALLPYSFFPAGIESRYTYLASIPFTLLITYLAWMAIRRTPEGAVRQAAAAIFLTLFAMVVVLAAFETRKNQAWITDQAAAYHDVYLDVPELCGSVAPQGNIYILNPGHFDLFGVSSRMMLNLHYEDVFVDLRPDGTLPELTVFAEEVCVVRFVDGRYRLVMQD